MAKERVSVLFVCLGNICRSPTAEGVFRERAAVAGVADRVLVDSAGCAGYHVGEPPDRRSTEAAARRGVDLSRQRARKVAAADLDRFDYVLCADRDNLREIQRLADKKGGATRATVDLFLRFAVGHDEDEIPDPYYGGPQGFEHVLDLCEAASDGLLADIHQRFPL